MCKDNQQYLCLHYHTMKSPAVSKASGMWNHYINVYWHISIQIKARASKQLVKHYFQKKSTFSTLMPVIHLEHSNSRFMDITEGYFEMLC